MKLFKNKKLWILGIITILWMLVIYFLSAQNGNQTTKLSLAISEFLSEIMGERTSKEAVHLHLVIRKLAHIVLFFGLGAISYLLMMYGVFSNRLCYRRSFSFFVAFVLTSGYGYFDEWHKQFIVGRHFQLEEVGLNVVSGCIGILVVWGIQSLWQVCKREEWN